MNFQALTPVVVGVGDIINRSLDVKDAIEPRQLMVNAIRGAIRDTGLSEDELQIDSLDVVACWTWPYDDLPGLISKDLNLQLRHKYIPDFHGGNQPAKFLDEAARRISLAQSKVAVICGGEALASLTACAKARKLPPPGWTKPLKDVKSVFSASTRELQGLGGRHGIGAPIHIYPLYENALRAHRGQSIQENNSESAQLYGDFARVATQHPLAWNYGKPAKDAAQISTVSEQNRMICFPYPLLMNAFNTVNIAGACVLTSTEHAQELGIPESKWIYPLGGAGTRDSYDFWLRPNYYRSPSISRSIDAALVASGLTKDDIDLYDFYSCFPVVPKLACKHLGLSITSPAKPITLLGGLTSFGGAGNNYSMHALTEMVRQLRGGKGETGLVLANGGVVTYQHVVCLSSKPRSGPYPTDDALPEVITDIAVPEIEKHPEGEAVVETYTVEFSRDGEPSRGHVVGILRDGKRFLANHGDQATLMQLASTTKEPIGRRGMVRRDKKDDINLFSFTDSKI